MSHIINGCRQFLWLETISSLYNIGDVTTWTKNNIEILKISHFFLSETSRQCDNCYLKTDSFQCFLVDMRFRHTRCVHRNNLKKKFKKIMSLYSKTLTCLTDTGQDI